jgi:Na+/H+ antiporter NhaD/arsenite permease-like protein
VALLGASLFMLAGHAKAKENGLEDLHYLTDVEWKTIFFFIGLFILVGALVKVGAIRELADRLVELTRGNTAGTTFVVLWGSAVLSAIVDNIPYVAAMNPLIVDLARSLHPTVTEYGDLVHQPDIGASANVVIVDIARRAGYPISFWQFSLYGLPVMFGSIVISHLYLWLRFF